MNYKIITGALCLLLFCGWKAFGQQTIADFNLLDRTNKLSSDAENVLNIHYLNDKNDGTFFEIRNFTGSPVVSYESDIPVIVTAYNLVSANDSLADPNKFRLKASNDKVNWTTLSSVLGAKFSGRFQSLITPISRREAYQYFQLELRGSLGGTDIKLAEFQLLGYIPEQNGLCTEENGSQTGQYTGSGSDILANILTNDYSKKFKQNNATSCWIDFRFNEPRKAEAYSITSTQASSFSQNIRSWELLASDNGTDWVLLDERSNKNLFEADNNMQRFTLDKNEKEFHWNNYADSAQNSMIRLFWKAYGNGYYLTHNYHPNPANTNKGYNYWWMAHALDVFIDAYNRTGDEQYITRANQIYRAQLVYGNNSLKNGFFDDMEWMGLACLRAYEATNTVRWKDSAIDLWNWIKQGWNDHHGGGIQWVDVQPESKNACSNAPAIILAARLYQLTNQQEYLDWAIRIFDWMNANLIFPNGIVKDGYGNENWGWTLTYNQGTWIGACLELYKITRDQKYYDIAVTNADFVISDREKFSPHGVLYNNEGKGDGGLFKGIFMRYLSQWLLSGELDQKRQYRYTSYFIECGKSLWETATQKEQIIFGNTWLKRPAVILPEEPTTSGYDASVHLSGVMLFELLDELERNHVIQEYAAQRVPRPYQYYRLAMNSNNGGQNIELSKWQLFSDGNSGINNSIVPDHSPSIEVRENQILIKNEDNEAWAYRIIQANGQSVASGFLGSTVEVITLRTGFYVVFLQKGGSLFSKKILINR